jgi:hypothetical protein
MAAPRAGVLYVWGRNSDGQCSVGPSTSAPGPPKMVALPHAVTSLGSNVVAVACGTGQQVVFCSDASPCQGVDLMGSCKILAGMHYCCAARWQCLDVWQQLRRASWSRRCFAATRLFCYTNSVFSHSSSNRRPSPRACNLCIMQVSVAAF